MDDLPALQKVGERVPDCLIDGGSAQTASHDQHHRAVRDKAGQRKGGCAVSFHQLPTDRASGENGLFLRQILDGLREITADPGGGRHAQLVGKSRCQVGFMTDHRDMVPSGRHDHRNGYEAAFGKDHIGFQGLHERGRFRKSPDDPEGVREIFPVKIPAEFAGGDSVIGNFLGFDQFFLNAVLGADIGNVIACQPQAGKQRDIRSHMSGGAASGKYDSFHMMYDPP